MKDDDWIDLSDVNVDDPAATTVATKPEPKRQAAAPPAAPAGRRRATTRGVRSAAKGDEGPLYWDLETIPDESRMHLFGLPELPPAPAILTIADCPPADVVIGGTVAEAKVRLAGVYGCDEWFDALLSLERGGKNRDGICKEIQSARSARDEASNALAERSKLLSTTPEYCAIAAFGWALGDGNIESLVLGENGVTEVDILTAFWDYAKACKQLCGFNILRFDIPVVYVRSALLGIPSSRMIDLKPWGGEVLDIYLLRFGPGGNSSKDRPGRLKDLSRVYGIDVPAGDMDGGDVASLMAAKDYAKVGMYVRSDIAVLRDVHKFYRGYFC